MMDANRRRRSRVDTHFTVNVSQVGGSPVQLVTSNISLKGLLAEPEPLVKGGLGCRLRIVLSSDAMIFIHGQVIRSDETGVAIDFLPMDEQSFFHLRNLVRYNAPDADQIDAELKTPAFD